METDFRFRVDVLTERAAKAGDTTHDAIATRAGVQPSTISRLLAGAVVPTVGTVVALALAYGTTLDDLVVYGAGLADLVEVEVEERRAHRVASLLRTVPVQRRGAVA